MCPRKLVIPQMDRGYLRFCRIPHLVKTTGVACGLERSSDSRVAGSAIVC